MKQQKNKIIFIAVIVSVVLFIAGYYLMVVSDSGEADQELQQPTVPELKGAQKEYSSKLEAVNDVKKERKTTAPSVYDETYIDSTGLYDPDLEEKRRQQIVDSIYRHGRIDYKTGNYREPATVQGKNPQMGRNNLADEKQEVPLRDFTESHAAFFDSDPHVELPETKTETLVTDDFIVVEVNGEQTVRTDERLELRLAVDAKIKGETVPRNTLIFGFVSFQPNRVLLKITNIEHRPVDLKAYDLLDGNEGIYIKNSFRADAQREVLDDVVQDINIAGVPQVSGIKQVFRRNNRNIKVTVRNQYQLILKRG